MLETAEKGCTLASILANLGQEVLSVVSAPRGLDVEVGIPTLFDELDASCVQPGDVVLGVGVAARPREAVGFVEEAGACGAAAVVLKLGSDPGPELIEAAARTGVALLSAPTAVAWGHLYTLLRVAGGATPFTKVLLDAVPGTAISSPADSQPIMGEPPDPTTRRQGAGSTHAARSVRERFQSEPSA